MSTILLDPLKLDYVLRDEVLMITTADEARARLDPRVYTTDGLALDQDTLIDVIVSVVAPQTWDAVGGTGKIAGLGKQGHALVIAQTDRIHGQIEDLLERLARSKTK